MFVSWSHPSSQSQGLCKDAIRTRDVLASMYEYDRGYVSTLYRFGASSMILKHITALRILCSQSCCVPFFRAELCMRSHGRRSNRKIFKRLVTRSFSFPRLLTRMINFIHVRMRLITLVLIPEYAATSFEIFTSLTCAVTHETTRALGCEHEWTITYLVKLPTYGPFFYSTSHHRLLWR